MVPDALFDDKRLSIEAKGTHAYLLSRPDNWRIIPLHLRGKIGVGRDRLDRIIGELLRAGYWDREDEQPRDRDNRFSSYNYVVRDLPRGDSVPQTDFPARLSRQRKTRIGIKNTDSKNIDSNNTPSKSPPPDQVAPPLVADEELSEFGKNAREAGLTFVFENSAPYRSWLQFGGESRIPVADVMIVDGMRRRGVWMPSLFTRYGGTAS